MKALAEALERNDYLFMKGLTKLDLALIVIAMSLGVSSKVVSIYAHFEHGGEYSVGVVGGGAGDMNASASQ